MPKKEQTDRILKAVRNPHTTILGHMTGRQLQRRPGYEIDIAEVLKACAEYGVAVEINAHPWRLDLDWRWHEKALDCGCMLSINPDAHSIRELDHMHWGIEMARKGGVPADRVLNAMALPKLLHYLSQRRRSVGRAALRPFRKHSRPRIGTAFMVTHTADSNAGLSACVTQHAFEPIFCLLPSLFFRRRSAVYGFAIFLNRRDDLLMLARCGL